MIIKLKKRLQRKIIKEILKTTSYAIIILLIILTVLSSTYGLKINEIMFNPLGQDTGREWIEIYNDDNYSDCSGIILEEFKLFEDNTNHNIYPYNNYSYTNNTDNVNNSTNNNINNINTNSNSNSNNDEYRNNANACRYSIICSNCDSFVADYPLINTSTALFKSSFSLSNTGEFIALKYNGTIVDSIDYSFFATNISEGRSIAYYNYSWHESSNTSGSPGNPDLMEFLTYQIENQSSENVTGNVTINNTINITVNSTINITSNLTDANLTNVNLTDANLTSTNITINLTGTTNFTDYDATNFTNDNETETNTLPKECAASINILIKNESQYYNNKETIKFQNKIIWNETYFNYSIEYWVEDLFGNIIKNKLTTQNQAEKSFTPDIDEKDRIFIIKNRIASMECNTSSSYNNVSNSTMGNIISSKMILIKNSFSTASNSASSKSSSSKICSVSASSSNSDSSVSTAQNLESISYINITKRTISKNKLFANFQIYKGDTLKSVVDIYLMNSRNKTVSDKYSVRVYNKYSKTEIDEIMPFDNACENLTLVIEGLGLIQSENVIANCSITKDNPNKENISTSTISYSSSNALGFEYPTESSTFAKNITNYSHADQISGTVVYESPNQKNKIFSFAGILLLFLVGVIIVAYKFFANRRKTQEIQKI